MLLARIGTPPQKKCNFTLMEYSEEFCKIILETFSINEKVYTVAISPDFFNFQDSLHFNYNFKGLVIHPLQGTILFTLSPDEYHTDESFSWSVIPSGILEPAVIDELNKIISMKFVSFNRI